ncbi:MAG: glutamine--fructose-6-phosphate transaminase (isomerizing) [Candidatus Peregrinibacteria bacterium]|nr:glutamine--fructose-6-phosphate transaminase (isomerizing) [Candidatus Peregrinibacteria bacterium]MDZ4244867.1 glutamine--fructose-6-phosphate transaminase (isomerizing) [Candidatus Gracilibacteria bacterium]
MCGVFSYLGSRTNVEELVVKGLKSLEYRGYDSWGIAYKTDKGIEIEKEVGKISDSAIKRHLTPTGLTTNIAIGHSRWATHGGVTQMNAHPHHSADKNIVLVHNGIIENFFELKKELQDNGVEFYSETDTEVFAHLINLYIRDGLEEAVKKALSKIKGRFAIVVICKTENKLIAARVGSPLIIGINKKDHEYFIASDIPAFLEYTKDVMYLDDGQMVTIDQNGAHFYEIETGKRIEKRIITIDWEIESAEKGDFAHFMLKEIMEQKDTLHRAINQDTKMIIDLAAYIKSAYGTFLIGCGTAGKVCMVAEYLFAHIAKRHINVTFGSEFNHYKHFIKEKSLMIAISQSGETADTLEAIDVAKKAGAKVASIINVETSTMARLSDFVLPVKAGPEKAVASTKVTTSQIAILTLLAYALADRLIDGKQLLINTAAQINDMLNPRYEQHIRELAEKIYHAESMYIIGKDMNYPIALEAAIKLQEVSYIHAEGFAGGELKHGPIALISKGTPVIAIVANDEYKQEILSNAMEIKARGGYIIGVSPEESEIFDYWIKVPDAGNASPIVNIIPIQLLAYKLAVLRENNPDMPRNLAKSVTVK